MVRRVATGQRLLKLAVVVLGLLVTYFLANLVQVWRIGANDQKRAVDAIVVLGAAQYDGRPSPVLAARLEHVLALWNAGYSRHVVVTGGKQTADRFTEADTSATYLIKRGVPASAIWRETKGRTSWQSMQSVAAIAKANGVHTVLLVSDPYHMARLKGMADELGLDGFASATHTSPIKGLSAFHHMLQEAAGTSLARVIGYRHLAAWGPG